MTEGFSFVAFLACEVEAIGRWRATTEMANDFVTVKYLIERAVEIEMKMNGFKYQYLAHRN